MSEEDSEAARAAAEARAKECRSMVTYVDGVEKKCLVRCLEMLMLMLTHKHACLHAATMIHHCYYH